MEHDNDDHGDRPPYVLLNMIAVEHNHSHLGYC